MTVRRPERHRDSSRSGVSVGLIALIVLWPLCLLAAWVYFFAPANVDGAGTPVVVYEVNERMRLHSLTGLEGEDMIRKLDEEVEVLVQGGYVVIDARTILGAPPKYTVGDEQ